MAPHKSILSIVAFLILEGILKMHLTSNGRVAIRFKMLTYCVYAPLLNRIDALPLNVIYYF